MSRYCLDTSAYGRFQSGEPRVVALVDSADWIGVPAVVLGELWAGFLQGRKAEANARELKSFLAHPLVHVVPIEQDAARIFGEIVADLRSRGTPIPTNDIWVGAAAVRAGASVLTFDRHFRAMGRVGAIVLEP